MSCPSVKQVYIRSRRPHHPALCVTKNNRVVADQFRNARNDECWTLHHHGQESYHITIELHSDRQLYLKADRDGRVWCEEGTGNINEVNYVWIIEFTRKGYVSIKSCFNKYLCADEDFHVTADREHCELWEQWAILDEPHLLTTPLRKVYIRNCHQQVFRNNDGLPALSSLSAKANCYGPATDGGKWRIMCIDDNKVVLNSPDGYLSSDEDGTVKLIRKPLFSELDRLLWTVENVEGNSINTIALKSKFGRYLCRDNGGHFMGDGSVKADSTGCRDKRTWWVFLTDSDDVDGNTALEKDAITMRNYNVEYA